MTIPLLDLSDRWFAGEGPEARTVVSSRCRLARNLAGVPFSRTAQPVQQEAVARRIADALSVEAGLKGFQRIELSEISTAERAILREAHLISPELERHADHCAVYLADNARISIMVNEEDHLRMQAIETGYRVREAHRAIDEIDSRLSRHLTYAFSPQLGHLTACPTNTGTGLRASAMLHLPGLVLAGRIDRIVKDIANNGYAVRGFYGEGTHSAGDLYQISNEVTLGKSEEEIISGLLGVVDQLIEHEHASRDELFAKRRPFIEDSIWRSYATLSQARLINSSEAISLLSRLRLGIDGGHFNERLTHHDLNRLLIEIQPAHLASRRGLTDADDESRDAMRAEFLRQRLADIVSSN
ncbi:protein arginine kinase [Candidatus Sumerlaeota bacterium]|nr:protein arginine kinase [Candidatus Sumerlaeota bacterium]